MKIEACHVLQALYSEFSKGAWLMTPNCYALDHEADLLVLRRSGLVAEYEIKLSRADFRADFKKELKHQLLGLRSTKCANYFYYVAPPGIIPPDEVPPYAGLLEIIPPPDGRYSTRVETRREAPRLHSTKHYEAGAGRLVMKMAESNYHRHFGNLPRCPPDPVAHALAHANGYCPPVPAAKKW